MSYAKPHLNFGQAAAPRRPVFKVLAAYENHAALFGAGQTMHRVEALCGGEAEIECGYWNFALFRNEELRKHASKEAGLAEMIIIALRGGQELPPHVKHWVESWPVRPAAGCAALVVLAGRAMQQGVEGLAQIAYLRCAAEACRLDFLCDRDEREDLDFTNRLSNAGEMDLIFKSHQGFASPLFGTGSIRVV